MTAECLHGIFKTHVVPYDLRSKIYFNLNVNQPHTDWDRSRILDLDYGTIPLRIFLFYVLLITKVLENV